MQKYKRLSHIIIVSLLLFGFWTIVLLISFLFQKPSKSNSDLIPEEINLVVSVNTKELINTFLFDILFKSDLDEASTQLFKLKERKEIDQFGIDLSKEVILFYDLHDGKSTKGVLFNLANENNFKRYQLENNNVIRMSNDNLGVLIYLDKKSSAENIKHYEKLSHRIINENHSSANTVAEDEIVRIRYKGESDSYFKDLNFNINIEDQHLSISGKGKLNKKTSFIDSIYTVLKRPNKQRFFEIQTLEVPQESMDLLTPIFEELHLEIPKISSQQIIFYGIEVDNIAGSAAFLPQLDWVLRFGEATNIDSLITQLPSTYNSGIDLKHKTIQLGSIKYYYKQISEKEIYLGVTKNPYFEDKKTEPIHLIRGYPEAILNIEGKGLVAKFITILPQVKFTKQLLEDVTYFDIHSIHQEDSLLVDGEIRLQENQLMSVELAKYLLRLSN